MSRLVRRRSPAVAALVAASLLAPMIALAPDRACAQAPDPSAFLDTSLRALTQSAEESYRAGDYQEAADRYLELLRHNITDATAVYNLACCYALLGDAENASRALTRAFRAGFRDVAAVSRDTDFDRVRSQAGFAAVVDSLSRSAADAPARGDEIWIEAPGFFRTLVQLPDGYDPARQWPLVLGLHGRGDTPERFAQLRDQVDRRDFIFAVLQAPYPLAGPARLGYRWFAEGDSSLTARSTQTTLSEIASIIRELENLYPVDKTFLLGFSQGAYMAINFSQRYPELTEGIVAFGGWARPEAWGPAPSGRSGEGHAPRVFLAHGRQDLVIPFSRGTEARDLLVARGVQVRFREFRGPHTVDPAALAEGLDWVRQ